MYLAYQDRSNDLMIEVNGCTQKTSYAQNFVNSYADVLMTLHSQIIHSRVVARHMLTTRDETKYKLLVPVLSQNGT